MKTNQERIKESTMAQWINILWNNSFVNLMRLPLLCEITGVIALAQLGVMTDWQAGSWPDEILLHLKIFRSTYILNRTLEI